MKGNSKKVQFLSVMIFLVLGNSFAQTTELSRKEKKRQWEAETAIINKNYPLALSLLQQNLAQNTLASSTNFWMGKTYFLLQNYDSAKVYLEKGMTANPDAYYYLAFIHLHLENFPDAEKRLAKYNTNGSIDTAKVEQLKNSIQFAQEALQYPEVVNIINLGKSVNTDEDEYVPLITANEDLLIFTSKRKADNTQLDPYGNPFENIYFSENKDDYNSWTNAQLLKGKVNTANHDACVGLSPDGNVLYIFRTNKNLIGGDLYESYRENETWSIPVRMSENINGFETIEPSASISLDGMTFYFSSNRPGGYGGFDLYRVKKLPNGEWSLPLNLGPTINTQFDEDAPFIHPNGKDLYFSSKGFDNMGGYDIFKSVWENGEFKKPINLGAPTNTTKDDIYFTISGNEKHGYYSTDKPGGFGGLDIFMIDYLEKNLRQSVITGNVMLENKPKSVEITLIEVETGELAGVYVSNKISGRFIFLVNPNVEYELIIEGEEFEEYYETISYTVDDLLKKQRKQIQLSPIK